jgi:hypothetical protein
MKYREIYQLQNEPKEAESTIIINKYHPQWEEIFQRWKDGKNPTDSREWKHGIIAKSRSIGKME